MAATLCYVRGDESRRRRGCHVDIPWRRLERTTPACQHYKIIETRFPAGAVAGAWDAQKRRLAERAGTTFVEVFETPGDGVAYTASDNVHPNESGYELWAQHIVGAMMVDGAGAS